MVNRLKHFPFEKSISIFRARGGIWSHAQKDDRERRLANALSCFYAKVEVMMATPANAFA